MTDRAAIRNNAKYLRQVRPIDPDEISEYVADQPHPAVVRQVLREEAFDLGLREREDGTFVPFEDGPAPRADWQPTAFPESYAFTLSDLLVREFGTDWHRDESGDRLRTAIRRLKTDYFHQNDVEYDRDAALGYAVYHLPDYYAAVGYVLDDLAENGLLPRRLRVLDVGAGAGGPALGLLDYLPDDALVDYHAVEPSPAADVLETMLGETRRNVRTTVHRTTVEAFDPRAVLPETAFDAPGEGDETTDPSGGEDAGGAGGPFDLVLFGNVLSELDDPAAVVERAMSWLRPDGSLVALAPADRNTAIGLREVERAVVRPDDAASVYSPTLRLWPGVAPSDTGWSFDRRPDVTAPPFQQRLDEAGEGDGTFTNETVQFAYAILRPDGRQRADVRPDRSRFARMANMGDHVTNRVDLLAVKLSRDLSAGGGRGTGGRDGRSGGGGGRSRGRGGDGQSRDGRGEDPNPVYKVGDGSESLDHYAVCTRESGLNRDLARADYGAVLAFENVLVLWNDDEHAYNLVVDAETVVDVAAP
jgi:SAM-dependent methyltransferase